MKEKCCFCGGDLDGIGDIGHNAEPLKDGRSRNKIQRLIKEVNNEILQ